MILGNPVTENSKLAKERKISGREGGGGIFTVACHSYFWEGGNLSDTG